VRALQMTGWQSEPELREVERPGPGPGEVLLRMGGAGVCHSDLHVLYEFPAGAMPWQPPFTLGHENAGWVEAVGAGVSGLERGLPVAVHGPWGCGICRACAAGAENYCRTPGAGAAVGGLGRNGAWPSTCWCPPPGTSCHCPTASSPGLPLP
jgi:propanol-preferring alcohol dehydrogenase